ncbi:MAG: ATP-binding protein [Gammaproteobacteria bacterium]|nr:ATP-binding protein [Gammaproteobacteria bacterium]
MAVSTRYLASQVQDDLATKMVFVTGPRQVGKTTLALDLPDARAGYLNWDVAADRERILRRELPATGFWVFDELHKYRPWRNYLKGLYDSRQEGQRILVTGSGRLELFSFGGDSLQGRYHLLRLHPFSVAEAGVEDAEGLADLLRLGGFPEPYLGGNEVEARRWSRQNRTRLIEEDVTGTTSIRDLGRLEEMMLRLPDLVGSPLSINALREDLQVAHKTVASWLDTLERLFALFRLPPFGAPRIRAVKQERKHYHFDWSLVAAPGARFENLLACHLLKWVHYEQDTQGRDLELRFFRDIDGREVDFVVLENRRPLMLVECKLSDRDIDRGLRYLKARFPGADARQIALYGERDFVTREGIRAMPALDFLRTLP